MFNSFSSRTNGMIHKVSASIKCDAIKAVIKFRFFCLLLIASLLLSSCSTPQSILQPKSCLKLMNDWSTVAGRMKKSGRFDDQYILVYIGQYALFESIVIDDNKRTYEQKDTICLKVSKIIEPQINLSTVIGRLPESHLKKHFPLPGDVIFGKKGK